MKQNLLLILALITLLPACSPEKRLERLLALHPELYHRRDTVIYDTAIVEYVHYDTQFVSVPGDTVYIDRERLHIKYVRGRGDTVYIDGKCDGDTVIKVVKVPQQIITPCPPGYQVRAWWRTAAIILGSLFALVFLLILAWIKRKRNNGNLDQP